MYQLFLLDLWMIVMHEETRRAVETISKGKRELEIKLSDVVRQLMDEFVATYGITVTDIQIQLVDITTLGECPRRFTVGRVDTFLEIP